MSSSRSCARRGGPVPHPRPHGRRRRRGGRLSLLRFGYTILYVEDVAASLDFYERAFGQSRSFVHESGQYGELGTGATVLAFAAHELAALNPPGAYRSPEMDSIPTTFEICFVTDDVQAGFTRAGRRRAPVTPPQTKPWGQDVAYVRDPDGNLVEIASPVT